MTTFGKLPCPTKRNERDRIQTKNENTAKTKLIDFLPLISVWLQVRVLRARGG
jgi:hypothetical protein